MSRSTCTACGWKGVYLGQHIRHCPSRKRAAVSLESTLASFPKRTLADSPSPSLNLDTESLAGDDMNMFTQTCNEEVLPDSSGIAHSEVADIESPPSFHRRRVQTTRSAPSPELTQLRETNDGRNVPHRGGARVLVADNNSHNFAVQTGRTPIALAQRLIDMALAEDDDDDNDDGDGDDREDVADEDDLEDGSPSNLTGNAAAGNQVDNGDTSSLFLDEEYDDDDRAGVDVIETQYEQDSNMLRGAIGFVQQWTDSSILEVIDSREADEEESCLLQFPLSDSNNDAAGGINAAASSGIFNKDPDNIDVSTYNPRLLRHTDYFAFRLELALLVDSLKPKPPNSFIDKLLLLLQKFSGDDSKMDLSRPHVLNDTFLHRLRKITGHTAMPEELVVSIESASYESMDQYEDRNDFRDTATLIRWNAFDQVRSILGCKAIFGRLENLVVNQTGDPFAKYEPPDGRISEVMTGQWYDCAIANVERKHEARTDITDKKQPFGIPTMLGVDATGVDSKSRVKTEPLLISSALIAEQVRNQTFMCWKPLGLMPPLDHKSKNARKRERQGDRISKLIKSGLSTRNYHRLLARILESFIELQEKGLVLRLTFGNVTKDVHCYFPLALWLGDIKSQDMLSGRVMSHRKNSPRLCWQCYCVFIDIDNPDHECAGFGKAEYEKMLKNSEDITVYDPTTNRFFGRVATTEQRAEYVRRHNDGTLDNILQTEEPWAAEPIMDVDRFEDYIENLKSVGCVRVDSVMNRLDYGGNPAGQFQALSIDMLHSLPGGIVKQVVTTFIRGLPSATKELFEKVADRIFLGQRSSENQYFPRMTFTHGCTNLTEMTCREWVGLMMTVLVVCRSYSGHAVLSKFVRKTNISIERSRVASVAGANDGDDEASDDGSDDGLITRAGADPDSVEVNASDFIHVAEGLLAFYGYANRKTFWKKNCTRSAEYFRQSSGILLKLIKTNCPRMVGNGWRLAKVHAMLIRMSSHITMFGAPTHGNCESLERSISLFAKTPAVNTNRQNYSSVTKATAKNLDTSLMLREAEFTLYETGSYADRNTAEPEEEHETGYVPRSPEWRSSKRVSRWGFYRNPSYFVGHFDVQDAVTGVVRRTFGGKWQRTRAIGHMAVPPMVMNHLYDHMFRTQPVTDNNNQVLRCYTEMFLTTGKRIRCHPNFRSNGKRFDWVLLREDPFRGVNLLFEGYDGSQHAPVPSPFKNVPPLDDSDQPFLGTDGNPIFPPTVSFLMGRVQHRLGVSPDGILDDEKYFRYAWKPLYSAIPSMLGVTNRRNVIHPETKRFLEVPRHYYVSDLPQPSMTPFFTDHQMRFGEKVVPAKVLCLFEDPHDGSPKALVHPCCHRTLENYAQSSAMIDNWTLQYSYLDPSETGVVDRMVAKTCVVDVRTGIIDRIPVWQEFPGYNDILDPSSWDEPPEDYGLKPPSKATRIREPQLFTIKTNDPRNFENRRRVSDAKRNVMTILPMEFWGNEFTKEYGAE